MSPMWERTSRLNCERSGRVGKASEQLLGVAVEVPSRCRSGPTGRRWPGLRPRSRRGMLRAGPPFRRVGLAEVVDHNVKCGEEGVHVDHESRFLSLRDR